MPVKLSELQEAELKEVKYPVGEDFLILKYSYSGYTPKVSREINSIRKEDESDGIDVIPRLSRTLIREWDLVDEVKDEKTGKMKLVKVPLTEETFNNLISITAQSEILRLIAADNSPNPEKSENSDDTF